MYSFGILRLNFLKVEAKPQLVNIIMLKPKMDAVTILSLFGTLLFGAFW